MTQSSVSERLRTLPRAGDRPVDAPVHRSAPAEQPDFVVGAPKLDRFGARKVDTLRRLEITVEDWALIRAGRWWCAEGRDCVEARCFEDDSH